MSDTPETQEAVERWSQGKINIFDEMARMERERDEAREISRMSSVDWAEDHTHLQNLCRKAGATEREVEGDSYGVPGIMELADLLFEKLKEGAK